MSGLYNMVLGDGKELLRWRFLGDLLGNPDVGRYRDSWIEKGPAGPVIAVYTRNGGGNRGCSCDTGDCPGCVMRKIVDHPLYIRDADDAFDSTYATIWFNPPDNPDAVTILESCAVDPVDMSERWRQAIEALK